MNRKLRILIFSLLGFQLTVLTGCAAESADDDTTGSPIDSTDEQPPLSAENVEPPPDAIVLTLLDGASGEKGASCGSSCTNPCGIVYNRSGHTLQLARDSQSHFYCKSPRNLRDLPSGANSNTYGSPHWPDVDCVRSRNAWMVTNGRAYPPGEWVRIWTSKWVY